MRSLNALTDFTLQTAGIAVSTVVLDAVRDVQVVVHLAQVSDQVSNALLSGSALDAHVVSNLLITLGSGLNLCVVSDDLGQVHSVCSTVDDVSTLVLKDSTGLVSHGMDDTQQSVGESHTGQALCIVHGGTLVHVAVVGIDQIGLAKRTKQ